MLQTSTHLLTGAETGGLARESDLRTVFDLQELNICLEALTDITQVRSDRAVLSYRCEE